MALIVPVRENNGYLGFSKQTVSDVAVAPSVFPRWMDGSGIEIIADSETIEEGEGSRRTSIIIKNGQRAKIKLKAAFRANELGFFEAASMGSGSDVYTAPTVSTTLSANTVVGATTISVAANTGLTGSGTLALVIEPGTVTEEIAIFTIPPTGVGPYILTVANGGTLKLAHTSAGAVKGSASHVLTDQTDGDYYTSEVGLGNLSGGPGTAIRVRSCKVSSFERSGEHGKILIHEVELTGIVSVVQVTPATITLEQHLPFLFTHMNGGVTLDGSTSGDAANLTKFKIAQDNKLDEDTQAEAFTLAALLFGNLEIKVSYSAIFTSFSKLALIYFGSTTGTTDSSVVGLGSLIMTFTQPDTFQTVQYKILTLAYSKGKFPELKKGGKHFTVDIDDAMSIAAPLSGAGLNNAYLLQTTITNTQYSQY
jgi:hypothetical protein